MNIDYRDWERHYLHLRNDYQTKRKFSAQTAAYEIKDLNDRADALERVLNVIKESPMQFEVFSSELARRQVVLENLKRQISSLNAADARVKLMVAPTGGSGGGGGGSGTLNPLAASDKALLQRQRDVIKMQDEVLLDIEKGVDRLHGQALEIKSETTTQNKILDDLDNRVDLATEGLKQETQHAEYIRQRSDTCYMYICIIIEIIILLLLIVIMFVG